MRYFAMIDGERRGPFELSELTKAGVRPDTYVWCKGMADWEKAEDVADICRYFRQTIFDRMHPTAKPAAKPQQNPAPEIDPYAEVPPRYRNMMRRAGQSPEFFTQRPNTSVPPPRTLFLAFFLTIFCFPTGVMAIYYSFMAQKWWTEANRSESKKGAVLYSDREREDLRLKAHDSSRQAKMWIGITFFIGMIFYSYMVMRYS